MNTMIILGAGQFGRACANLVNTANITLLAFGDNNSSLWGNILGYTSILSVEDAVALRPDYAMIAVTDESRTAQLQEQASAFEFQGQFVLLKHLYRQFDIRSATLHRMADRLKQMGVAGDMAELGVYRGDMAWQLNVLFPERTLHLFDTFEGFDLRDIKEESRQGLSRPGKATFPTPACLLSAAVFLTRIRSCSTRAFSRTLLSVWMHADLPWLAWMLICMPRFWPGFITFILA